MNDRLITNPDSILYVPEGTTQALFEFIRLVFKLTYELPYFNHVLRVHPDLKINGLLKIILKILKTRTNFILSESALSNDLSCSKYLIYRSSAVGIESLGYNLMPIFYAKNSQSGLNVLFKHDTIFLAASCKSDLMLLLKQDSKELSFDMQKRVLEDLLTAINYEIVTQFSLK